MCQSIFIWLSYIKTVRDKALAFWALNENVDRSKDDLKKYVISIDKMEELTGIDFFCNLPDDVENKVEAATYTQSWKW